MDELEFRRRLYADPNTTDNAVAEVVAGDSEKAQLKNALQQLDSRMVKALKVPVPDDLAHKLIWQQQTKEQLHRQQRRSRWYVAMAASVALTVGITGTLAWHAQPVDISSEALVHMRYAETETPHSAMEVNMQQINAKLAGLGGSLLSSIGNVTVANYCHLNTTQSLHLILDTDQGRMSVFIVPQKNNFALPEAFADNRYHGESWEVSHAGIMVVGNKNANLAPLIKKVQENIIFSA